MGKNIWAIMDRKVELQEKIESCRQTIVECEKELKELRTIDVWDSGFNTKESLWLDLQRVQSGRESYEYYLGKYGEDPCFATAALLEKLLPKLQSGIRLLGCSILAQDKCAEFCITGCVDESIAEAIRVYGLPVSLDSRK